LTFVHTFYSNRPIRVGVSYFLKKKRKREREKRKKKKERKKKKKKKNPKSPCL
jgi:hypothetical protein